jgi:hypothetical protein
MSTRDRLTGLLALVIAFGVWCCILGFEAVAKGTNPVVWWSILLLLVIAPSICLGFLTRRWWHPPKI